MRRALSVLLVALATLVALPGIAATAPGKAAIASAHPLATDAGMEILASGGNAFDAAVAVSAVLAVVEPKGSGLGGGGFYLLHRANDRKDVFVDARETAPGAATATMFLDDTKAGVTAKCFGHRSRCACVHVLPSLTPLYLTTLETYACTNC